MPATLEELKNKVLQDGLKAKNKALVTMAQILLKIAEGKQCLEELRSEIIYYQKQCDEINKTRDHTAPGIVEAACVIGGLFVGDPTVAVETGAETLYDTLSEATSDFIDFVNTSIHLGKFRIIVSVLQTMIDKLQSSLVKYKEALELLENNPQQGYKVTISRNQSGATVSLQTFVDEVEPDNLDDFKRALKLFEDYLKENESVITSIDDVSNPEDQAAKEFLIGFADSEIEIVLENDKILDVNDHTLLHGILAGFCIKSSIENISTLVHSWEDDYHPALESIELVIEKLTIVEQVIKRYMVSMIKRAPPDLNKEQVESSVTIADKFTRTTVVKTNEDEDGISGVDALD